MILDSIEKFVKHIPTAEGSEWATLEAYIEVADGEIRRTLTGKDLYEHIEALPATEFLNMALSRLIAHTAYYNAIPFVDLIQTPNGFAVVSNTNQKPASKERVERLLAWCDMERWNSADFLVAETLATAGALAEWKKFGEFERLTNCIFVTGKDFHSYCGGELPSRKTFTEAKNDLLVWQRTILEKVVSTDLMTVIIGEIRENNVSEPNARILHLCRVALGKLYNGNKDEVHKLLDIVGNTLDGDLDSFPAYRDSPEYALKISPKYENKQSDPTFFFG